VRAFPIRLLPVTALLLTAGASGTEPPKPSSDLKRSIVRQYATVARSMYSEIEQRALELRARVGALLAAPSPETLAAARNAWTDARRVYGQSEVLRFYEGPIDSPEGVEIFVNAWPVDEAYIDYVRGNPSAGIINLVQQYPNLNATMLSVWNQRGGEANVSTGWHAIEFLLWGQDFDATGPGSRPHTDYVAGAGTNAARRAEYLQLATDLLVEHLHQVSAAWAAQPATYRTAFEAGDPDQSLRRILAGMLILSGFELTGERLAVPYETKDQEDEHSCFSDTTHLDLVANELGIEAMFRGCWQDRCGPGIADLARVVDPALAGELEGRIAAALAALRAIPPPFDQAMRAGDEAAGREAMLTAIEALEAQTSSLASLAAALGFKIAIEPGG
jgi:putative iron-regulated protein